MRVTFRDVVFVLLIMIMLYSSRAQDRTIAQQKTLIEQMSTNPACMVGEPIKAPIIYQ